MGGKLFLIKVFRISSPHIIYVKEEVHEFVRYTKIFRIDK